MSSAFITAARAALDARRGEWPALCAESGLSYWWVTKFAQGRIAEPGVSKIERLQDYFAKHPLAASPAQNMNAAPPGDAERVAA